MIGELTPRELETLRLVERGLSNKEIAAILVLSPKTVENKISIILSKLGVQNRTQAANWCNDQFGTGEDTNHRLLQSYTFYTKGIYELRVAGSSYQAIDMAAFASNLIEETIRGTSSPAYQKELRKLHAEVLYEQAIAYSEIYLPEQTWKVTQPIIFKLKRIARENQDSEVWGKVYFIGANAYYHNKNYAAASRRLTKALQCTTDADFQLLILKTLAASLAYQKEGFKGKYDQAREIIEGGNFSKLERVCEALEGLGRAHAPFGLIERGFDMLREAEEILAEMKHRKIITPLRVVQVARGKLELLCSTDSREDKKLLESTSEEGRKTAKEHGYERHATLMNELLTKFG